MGGYLTTERKEKSVVGIIAFEVAFLMLKLIRLWEFLRPEQVQIFRKNISDLVGIKKLVSEDDDIIQGLIRSELIWNMIPIIKYVARIGKNNCSDPSLKNFEYTFSDWISNGVDPFGWELEREKMDEEANKMWEFIKGNTGLYCHMKSLLDLERTLKDTTATLDGPNLLELQNKVELKRNEVENLKERSSWNMTFDYVGILLARSVFTIFSCIKSVYGVPELMITANAEAKDSDHSTSTSPLIFFSKYQLLDAPPDTLGAAALHYAEIVIKIENIVKEQTTEHMLFSRLFLYPMLPENMRTVLKERLLPIYSSTSSVKDIAAEREVELEKLLEWLAPLAHNTKKWHAKMSYKQKPDVSGSHLLLVQTLYFANQHKTEAAIVELIVCLQYRYQVWQEVEILRGNHHHSQEVCKEILRGNYPHS